MGRNKNRQYQLKVQQFYKLVDQYKQPKGTRQETIEMLDRCLHTVEKLRKKTLLFQSNKITTT